MEFWKFNIDNHMGSFAGLMDYVACLTSVHQSGLARMNVGGKLQNHNQAPCLQGGSRNNIKLCLSDKSRLLPL